MVFNYNKYRQYFACILLLISLNSMAEEFKPHKVLVLHSYSKGLSWTEKITEGIEKAFIQAGKDGLQYRLDYEYMDTKKFSNEEYYQLLYSIYSFKYRHHDYEAIIASDDDALNFLIKHRDSLFGKIPVIFCGVNFYKDKILAETGKITGVIEAFDLRANLHLILELHPDTHEIAIISDQTTTGLTDEQAVKQIAPEFADKLTFRFINQGTIQDYVEAVKKLDAGTVIIAMHLNRDSQGSNFTFEESFQIYFPHTKVPIYSPWDFFLGLGAVGGYMISGANQGYEAARMALRIIRGESIENIPVLLSSPNRYIFDYKQLQRFNISEHTLPLGSEIINKHSLLIDFYREYKVIIWLISLFILSLIITVFALIVNIIRRIRAEKERAQTYQVLEKTNQAYSRFVPHNFLYYLGHDSILKVAMGDQIQTEMTVLFTDIRSFTALSEQMTPAETFRFINQYLNKMGPIVREYNGFVDKYIGDAIMALFPIRPFNAILAAIKMQQELRQFNIERQEQAKFFHDQPTPLQIGIGIHTGNLMMGIIGEAERMESTVISDTVNLASRLEGLTAKFGASIMVSDTSLRNSQQAEGFESLCYRFLGSIKVKGKQQPINVFEIYSDNSDDIIALKQQTQTIYEQALDAYFAKDFRQALTLFQQVLSINPTDRAAQFYLYYCLELVDHPIPPDWNGVIRFDVK